jgi:hypothetical protein
MEQFEFLLANWINNMFFTVTDAADPLVGMNPSPAGGAYYETVPTSPDRPGSRNRVQPLNSFISTKGSAYCYYPGIDGISWIAQQSS